jgi:apolipoprotein N-acyltransferase
VNIPRINKSALNFCAGLLAVLGFAPFSLFPLTIFALAVLFVQWFHAGDARAAAKLGFAFGLGLFGAGIGWIYVALHDYGNMPVGLSLPVTALFAAFIALFPALAGYLQARLRTPAWARLTLVMPALWVLIEWLRGWILTGFPWLAFGYSQVADSPLVGYAPLIGAYGVSLAVAVSAGLFAWLWFTRWSRPGKVAIALLAMLWLMGVALRTVEWTQPQGEPFTVSLVQGNIPQERKFEEGFFIGTLELYRKLIDKSDARLVVLPESALPMLKSELSETYLSLLREHMQKNGGDLLYGAFDGAAGVYYNSVFSLGVSPNQTYHKNHLVPFGEFIPWRSGLGWIINDMLNIPMSDLARGGIAQPPLAVAGQKVAVDICYEDVFGEEIIRALPEAAILVNVSDDAWYGNSHAAMQHNQIAQMRALETGRMMLRATNTGVTSIIGRSGRILQMLPQHEEGILSGQAQGYVGSTPYVRWGNAALLALLALMLGAGLWLNRRA